MYRDMGFEVLEERIVEPKPGWRFRSHLLYADAERLLRDPPASRDRGRDGVRHRLRRPAGGGMSAVAPWSGPGIGARRRGGAARRHHLPADPARRGGSRTPRRARSSWWRIRASWSSTSWPRSSSSSSEAARRARRSRAPAARGGRARARRPRAGRASARGSSIRGAAGWCTSCPSRCTASCASTATATRSRRTSRSGLARLRVAVAGLSVGRAVVSTMAHEGIGGELRLADFDVLDLSNLNRVAGRRRRRRRRARSCWPAREVAELDPYIRVVAFPRGVEETTIARVRRRRRRDRRRVRRPGDEGAAARARARRRPAGGDGDEPSRDARRRALRPRARAAGLPRAARRRHLGRARRPDDQAEGPVRDPHPRPGEPHATARRRRWSRSRRRSRPGRSSRPTSRSAARWWPTPCGGSRSASSPAPGASTPTSTS